MNTAQQIGVAIIAFEHVYIMVLEMFLWTTPFGRRTFGLSQAEANATAIHAKNQGLYNGFLAAGLFWSLFAPAHMGHALAVFFVGCVFVAGVFGGLTAKRAILFVQALPALIVFILLQIHFG